MLPPVLGLASETDETWKGGGAWGRLTERIQNYVMYGRIDDSRLRDGTDVIWGHRNATEDRASAIYVAVLHPDGSVVDVGLTVQATDYDVCDDLIMKMYRSLRLGDRR